MESQYDKILTFWAKHWPVGFSFSFGNGLLAALVDYNAILESLNLTVGLAIGIVTLIAAIRNLLKRKQRQDETK